MFEKFTEKAKRILFLARYEASQQGSSEIETEHILLGMLKESEETTRELFARAKKRCKHRRARGIHCKLMSCTRGSW